MRNNINPPVLIDIFCQNEWLGLAEEFIDESENMFKVRQLGSEKFLQARKKFAKNIHKPILTHHLLVSYSATTSFILQSDGTLRIVNNCCKLACHQEATYSCPEDQIIVWVNSDHSLFDDEEATSWILVPVQDTDAMEQISNAQSDNNLFFIERPPGDEWNSSGKQRLAFNIDQNGQNILEMVGEDHESFNCPQSSIWSIT